MRKFFSNHGRMGRYATYTQQIAQSNCKSELCIANGSKENCPKQIAKCKIYKKKLHRVDCKSKSYDANCTKENYTKLG